MNHYVHRFLDTTIGKLFGHDITCREPIHHCDDYQPGTLTEFGRTGIKFFKKFLMPCGLCAAVPLVKPDKEPEGCPVQCNNNMEPGKLIRPSELPIYRADEPRPKMMPCEDDKPSMLEENIGHVRRSVQGVLVEYDNVKDKVTNMVDTGREHSKFMVDYLQEESNTLPRIGAIGIGGLTGLVLGLRGGRFKRFIYTSTGALTVGALVYPKQAQEGLELAKHYANITYNFAYGIKPGDEQLSLELPELPDIKMPSTLTEYFSLVLDFGKSAFSSVKSLVEFASDSWVEKTETSPPSDKKDK